MATDPAPFLSTIIGTSATLVAIVGGLLVARFVSLDSDERSNRKVLTDAAERLAFARRRADDARSNLLAWHARNFVNAPGVLTAIAEGDYDLAKLKRLADSRLTNAELRPVIAEVADEFTIARYALAGRVPASAEWMQVRRAIPDLPEIRWPGVWEKITDELAVQREAEEIAQAREAARANPNPMAGMFAALERPTINPRIVRMLAVGGRPDQSQTRARRYDDLIAAKDKAEQQVEDFEGELRRLTVIYKEVVRPDKRLWAGVVILVVFTAVGVALPVVVMSGGPTDIAQVRWLIYPFLAALAGLISYIVVYLAQLTRKRRPQVFIADTGAAEDV